VDHACGGCGDEGEGEAWRSKDGWRMLEKVKRDGGESDLLSSFVSLVDIGIEVYIRYVPIQDSPTAVHHPVRELR
jgi:hypothetical protein